MMHNPLNLTLLLQMPYRQSRKTTVYLQSFDQGGLRDHSESGYFLHDAVIRSLVESDNVLGLILDLSLGPLLLLC